jgi:uncharacterized protein YbcI
MARGWESKSVEAQQDEHQRPQGATAELSAEELGRRSRRRTLELSRARAIADLKSAVSPAYRRMLETALRAIDEELASLG